MNTRRAVNVAGMAAVVLLAGAAGTTTLTIRSPEFHEPRPVPPRMPPPRDPTLAAPSAEEQRRKIAAAQAKRERKASKKRSPR